MITYVQGSLFTSPAQVLVNTVNTVGVMGRGIAKEFRDIYPEMYDLYRKKCALGDLRIGSLFLYRTPHKWVLNFPTKRHFRYPSRLEYIEAGLQTFTACYAEYGLNSVAFPQLGCGTGGLDWESGVRPLMERYLKGLPIDAYIHVVEDPPLRTFKKETERRRERLRSEPKVLPFEAFWNDLSLQVAQLRHENGTNGWRLSLPCSCEGSVLAFQGRGRTVEISRSVLFDAWQQLQAFGFLSTNDFPDEYGLVAEPLFQLMANLPYLERSAWAMDQGRLGTIESLGIQFVPPIGSTAPVSRPTLFSQDGTHLWSESPTPTT